MKEFIKNLICWLFGHQIDSQKTLDNIFSKNYSEKDDIVVWCKRCDNWRHFKKFKIK